MLLLLVVLESMQRSHPVLVISRDLLYNLLLLFDLIVDKRRQVLSLDHDDHAEQVFGHLIDLLLILHE